MGDPDQWARWSCINVRTSDGLIAHGCLGLSFCGFEAMGGGGGEAAGAQFRTLETQARRVLTVISSQKEKSGLSSSDAMHHACRGAWWVHHAWHSLIDNFFLTKHRRGAAREKHRPLKDKINGKKNLLLASWMWKILRQWHWAPSI